MVGVIQLSEITECETIHLVYVSNFVRATNETFCSPMHGNAITNVKKGIAILEQMTLSSGVSIVPACCIVAGGVSGYSPCSNVSHSLAASEVRR